ncbi:MAG: methylmalonyl-CoA mutase family protein, partial [Dehalococcoidia bacterium]
MRLGRGVDGQGACTRCSVQAIESGWMQQAIQNASYTYQQDVESGKQVVVGVNRYRTEGEEPKLIFRVDP